MTIEPITIVRAAVRWRGGVWSLPKPKRHGDVLMLMSEMFGTGYPGMEAEQGFLASNGQFYDRAVALRVAIDAKQCEADTRGELCSEDLW